MPQRSPKNKIKALSSKIAPPDAMLNATARSNKSGDNQKALAYYFGNMGDSIERRYNGFDGFGPLGGGNDAFQGIYGPSNSWNAQGPGNYFGTGLINGFGRMFSGVQAGQGVGGFAYLKRFSSNATFNHILISQCMTAYLDYGIVKNIVDLYADFATEDIDIEHPDASVKNFYRAWADKVGLKERVHSMFCNLLVCGTNFIHRRWAVLDDTEKRAMKRAQSSEMINDTLVVKGKSKDTSIQGREEGFIEWYLSSRPETLKSSIKQQAKAAPMTDPKGATEEKLPDNPEKKIPWGYTYLNPLQMEMRGKKIRNQNYWVMALDKKDTLEIARNMGMKSYQELGTTNIDIPQEFVARINAYQGAGPNYSAEIKLTNDELSVVQAPGKWDWFDWAVPFVYPCLRSLYFKDILRTMEIRAAQSVINSIFLFKLGNLEKGMPAEEEHFERLADMLQMPGASMNILWNEAIEAQVLQPKVDDLFDTDKHDSADRDIMTALGVPEVLIGGNGSNFSNAYVAVSAVMERLKSYRDRVVSWLMGELKIIADAMGFQKLPTIHFGRSSLQDAKAYQTFLLALYDRNIISADTVLEEAQTNVETEVSKMKIEKDLRDIDILEPRGPFVKPPQAAFDMGVAPPASSDDDGGKMTPKKPGGVQTGVNGRPPGSSTGPTGKQNNPRGPKGRNLAELLELHAVIHDRGKAVLDQLEKFVGDRYLSAKAKENPNLKHIKQLRQEERERMEQLIYNVFSHMAVPKTDSALSDDFIINLLKSDAVEEVKAEVFDIYTNKIADYSKTYGKAPTRDMRRQFMVSAWTQRAIMDHAAQKPALLHI
jgi:hypothetical protein